MNLPSNIFFELQIEDFDYGVTKALLLLTQSASIIA